MLRPQEQIDRMRSSARPSRLMAAVDEAAVLEIEKLVYGQTQMNFRGAIRTRFDRFSPVFGGLRKWFHDNGLVPDGEEVSSVTLGGGNHTSLHTDMHLAPHLEAQFKTPPELGDPASVLLVPLTMSGPAEMSTVVMDQMHFGYQAAFRRRLPKPFNDPGQMLWVDDYAEVEGITGEDFDVDDYLRLLTHVPYCSLWGLSVESVLPWERGRAVRFDRFRIHSSNDWAVRGSTDRRFLLTHTVRAVDEMGTTRAATP